MDLENENDDNNALNIEDAPLDEESENNEE